MLSAPMIRLWPGPLPVCACLARCWTGLVGRRRALFKFTCLLQRRGGLAALTLTHDAAGTTRYRFMTEPTLRRAVLAVNWVRAAYRSRGGQPEPAMDGKDKQPVLALLAEQEHMSQPSAMGFVMAEHSEIHD